MFKIDDELKVVTLAWTGDVTEALIADVIDTYQRDIKSKRQYADYNDMIDFTAVGQIKVTSIELLKAAQRVASFDCEKSAKSAFIVKSALAFGFAKIFATYRNFSPRGKKRVNIFKSQSLALEWLAEG